MRGGGGGTQGELSYLGDEDAEGKSEPQRNRPIAAHDEQAGGAARTRLLRDQIRRQIEIEVRDEH